MLKTDTWQDYMQTQNALGHTIPQTLRGMGLDIAPPDRDGETMTDDETFLTALAHAAMVAVEDMARQTGAHVDALGYSLQGVMIGLALGYQTGLNDADATPLDGDTFPEGWTPQGDTDA